MKKIICLVMILGTSQVFAKTMHFKCSGEFTSKSNLSSSVTEGDFESFHTVDMTKKVWEAEKESYDGVVVSPSQISVNADDNASNGVRKIRRIKISRNDLSMSDEKSFTHGSVTIEVNERGVCEVVEAPKVDRAF